MLDEIAHSGLPFFHLLSLSVVIQPGRVQRAFFALPQAYLALNPALHLGGVVDRDLLPVIGNGLIRVAVQFGLAVGVFADAFEERIKRMPAVPAA
ncbi:MAG: hypothetical protein NTW32_20990 [Chloroflexi bacterium]|nr:hypothetical protein [Chloroflexota bacterium]